MSDSNSQWFKKKSKAFEPVFAYIRKLDTNQANIQADNVRNMRLYGNQDYTGLGMTKTITDVSYNVQNRVTLNIVQSMIDTAVSKITKMRPRPYFLTDDGDFTLKRKAEKLTKFAEGQFYSTNFYETATQTYVDACIFGTGAIKIFIEDNKIKAERVFIDEIKVDEKEAYYGKPRQMHHTKWVHKDVLKAAWPAKASVIDFAASASDIPDLDKHRNGDMLLTIESWRLPSKSGAKDGRHTITIATADLENESYEKDYFPFVFFKWNTRPLGFFGQGIAEQLTGLQVEINKILRTIQVSMHLVSVPKLFLEASSKIVKSHLNNQIGGIIEYAGTKPDFGSMGQVPPELFTHLERLYNRAYEIIGISQLSSQSSKPSGLNSGKALRTFADIETERFQATAKRYEQGFLDATRIMIDLAKDLAEQTGNYEVKVPGAGFLKTIKWDDVNLEEDQYMLQIYPTNALSQTPSARLQEVQELMQAGLISKEDSMKLLDFPDLKSTYSMINAGVEDIERQIELMVDTGEYQTPEPFQNLKYGIVKMQQAYLKYRSEGAPEDLLENFRQWMSDDNNLMNQAAAEAQQAQANASAQAGAPMPPPGMPPEGGAPLAAPAAPPASDLMPLETATPPPAA